MQKTEEGETLDYLIDQMQKDEGYNPSEGESPFMIIMRIIKTARVKRRRNAEAKRKTPKSSMALQKEGDDWTETTE